jgi:hypothetical protein
MVSFKREKRVKNHRFLHCVMPLAMGIIEIELCLGSTSLMGPYFDNAQGLKCYTTLGNVLSDL